MKQVKPAKGKMPVVPQGLKNGGKAKPFAGKESKKEEKSELKFGKAAYAKGEKKEAKKMGSKKSCKCA